MKALVNFCLFAITAMFIASCSDNPVNSSPQPVVPTNQPDPRYNDNQAKDLDFSLTKTVVQDIPKNIANIPAGVYHFGREAHQFRQDTLPSWTGIQFWMHSVPIKKGDSGHVEIDYMALIEKDPFTSLERIIDITNYRGGERMLTLNEGGNFTRWYVDNSFKQMSNATIKDGSLQINFRPQDSNVVSHFWMNSSGKYSRMFDKKYSAVVRMRSSGSVATQAGIDLYINEGADHPNNRELLHTDWVGDTGGKFVIFRTPIN